MMRSVAVALSISLFSGAAYAQSGMPNYSSIWNLGDSLSDTGRTHRRTGYIPFNQQPKGNLYDRGRFSNGKVWVEYLNDFNGVKYDYNKNLAWGGAVSGAQIKTTYNWVIPSLESQITEFGPAFKGDPSWALCTGLFGCSSSEKAALKNIGASPLVTFWIGGNNFRQEIEDADTPDLDRAKRTLLEKTVPNLRQVNALVQERTDVANKRTTFYVGTVPDISSTPKAAIMLADRKLSPAQVTALGNTIRGTNRELKAQLYGLEPEFAATNSRIVVVDAAALLAEVQRNPGSYGFLEARKNCVDADSGKYTNGCSASNVGTFLFWDQFHPTTKAHEMIAQYAQTTDKLEFGAAATLDKPYVANIEIRDRSFAGPIGGSGLLIKQGEMTLTLGGTNTYTGGTRIDGGLVQISADANLGARQGLVTLQGGGLRASESFAMTRDLRVDAPVSYGQITPSAFGGSFVVDAGRTLTLQDNTISGTGDIAKSGAGTLDIRSKVADSRNLTEVSEGLLKINTSGEYRSTTLKVDEQGMLGGSGTIVGTVVNNGRIVPGNSIGTLTIVGDLVQQDGGVHHLEVDTHRADGLVVTGSVQLDGTVHVETDPGDKITNQSFTILSSAGAISGQYDEVTDLSPFLSGQMSYGPRSATVSFRRDFAAPAVTPNQLAVAAYLNASYRGTDQGDLDNVFHGLDTTVTNAAGADALDQLSGRSIGNLLAAGAIQRGQFTRALEDRMASRRSGLGGDDLENAAIMPLGSSWSSVGNALRDASAVRPKFAGIPAAPAADGISVWARVLGGPADVRGAGAFDMNGVGVLAGVDKGFGRLGLVGLSVGYGSFDSKGRGGGNGEADTYQVSLYGSLQSGRLFLDGTLGYAHSDYSTSRRLSFGTLSRVAAGSADGDDVTLSLKAGAVFSFAGLTAEPSLGFDWYHLSRSGFTETLAGAAGLRVASETLDLVMPSVGLRLARTFDLGSFRLSPELSARYYYNLGDTRVGTVAGLIGSSALPFQVETTGLGHSIGVVSAGLTAQHGEHLKLFGRYDLTVANNVTAHAFSAGLKYTW